MTLIISLEQQKIYENATNHQFRTMRRNENDINHFFRTTEEMKMTIIIRLE